MDWISHAALGGILAGLLLGREMGNKALLWGLFIGVLPDLDQTLRWLSSDWTFLMYQQSLTHSLLFVLLGGWLLGRLSFRFTALPKASRRRWVRMWFWVLGTHVLVDCCSTWGPQLLFPIWHHRVAGNMIGQVDLLYSFLLVAGLLLSLVYPPDNRKRSLWLGTGLVLSTLYLIATITNKQYVDAVFQHAFEQHEGEVIRMQTYPTLGNNLLWYGIAEMPYGYQVGYFSVLQGTNSELAMAYLPKIHSVPDTALSINDMKDLRWLSDRYYVVETRSDSVIWHDLRTGLGRVRPSFWSPPADHMSYAFTTSRNPVSQKLKIWKGEKDLSPDNLKLMWRWLGGVNAADFQQKREP